MASEIRKILPAPFLEDEENGSLTDEEIARLRPAPEVFAELGLPLPRPRGRPRKAHPKQQVPSASMPTSSPPCAPAARAGKPA